MANNFSNQYPGLFQLLVEHQQDHILKYWNELSHSQQETFTSQIKSIDFNLLGRLYAQYKNAQKSPPAEFTPAETISVKTLSQSDIDDAINNGKTLLKENKTAILLVAGGQGTRLGFDGPKGCYPILEDKTLFHIFAEKIAWLNNTHNTQLDWLIMTSKATDWPTQKFFAENNFFGLPFQSIRFFQQDMLPSVDLEGRLILDAKDHFAENPNGHGGTLLALKKSGCLENLQRKGIEQIFYFQVDNALTRMADPFFVGLHALAGTGMSTKAVRKTNPEEKVGIVGYINNRLGIIEYSEMSEEQVSRRNDEGSLVFKAANTAIHMLSTGFVDEETEGEFKLPYHIAIKKIPYLDNDGNLISPDEPNGIKFETFIFDALGDTKNSVTLEVERDKEFAPLKNASGPDSPETVREALLKLPE
ncbi:UTP--glucose-1-phosphate uridylyltransferase [Candidatus Margulisiibacteriota bacterium]